MSDFLVRLKKEGEDLQEKIEKLEEFLDSDKSATIDPIQQSLLNIQYAAMMTYAEVLLQRIQYLEKQPVI
jgi:cell division septum initiation protein DivIVA